MKEKKERIKDRMLKTAARLWGYPDVEVETSFDPIVQLMLEACASELEKISSEVDVSHEVFPGVGIEILKCATVQEVHQYFGHIIEHAYNGVGL